MPAKSLSTEAVYTIIHAANFTLSWTYIFAHVLSNVLYAPLIVCSTYSTCVGTCVLYEHLHHKYKLGHRSIQLLQLSHDIWTLLHSIYGGGPEVVVRANGIVQVGATNSRSRLPSLRQQ